MRGGWKRSLRILLLSGVARWTLRFLRLTTRRIYGDGMPGLLEALSRDPPIIVAFWHGQLALLQIGYPERRLCVQVSHHSDGEIIARAVRPLGIRTARGSATRGALAGLRGMIRAHDEGFDLGMAVDGPKGPRYRAKAGAIQLAAGTGAVIVPVAAVARRAYLAKSWDRFVIPAPGTKILYEAGSTLRVPARPDRETAERARRTLEECLIELNGRAAARIGRGDVATEELPG